MMQIPQNATLSPFTLPGIALRLTGLTAWAFAGQGSQIPGMGCDIYQEFPQTRPIFESTAAGFDLRELCFDSPTNLLDDTRYTQACMAAFAAAVVALLFEAGLRPSATLGLSLGEYSALHAAGVFDSQTLLSLLGFRGRIMAEASARPSRMTAVLGLSDEEVEITVAEIASKTGMVVSCTNYNAPLQLVIGGEEEAVIAAEEALRQRGARRCIPLKTSGPFHTALMEDAGKLLTERLATTCFAPQAAPVIFNASATPAPDTDIPALLVRQISSPVRFAQSIRLLKEAGISSIIEIGPGNVLAGLIRKTAPDIQVTSLQTADDIRKLVGT
ncbi:MAG: ACP S-malonyltransferase [Coriobacteriia bacterium]|nr:ACP S-malonyltransferase [Coriobacteriia bacterium]